MAYAQVSDVRGIIPYVEISRESKPSEGTVQQWITDIETILESALDAMGYKVPIVGPKSIAVLKEMVSNYVAAKVMRARATPEHDPATFQGRYDAILKALRDPNDLTVTLPDAEVTINVVDKHVQVRVSSNLVDLLEEDPMRIHRNQVF